MELTKIEQNEIVKSNLKQLEIAAYGATIRYRVAQKVDDKPAIEQEKTYLEKLEKMKMEYELIIKELS